MAGDIPWESSVDSTRPISGVNYPCDLAEFVDIEMHHFLRGYRRDLLQSQPDHIELVLEKMTVQNIIEPIAREYTLPVTVARGYCSGKPRQELAERFKRSGKDRLRLLFASDLDPDGDEIAESFSCSIRDEFDVPDIVANKILLRWDQIKEWGISPSDCEAKKDSPNYQKFVETYNSTKVYELEAIPPKKMQEAVGMEIASVLCLSSYNEELEKEKEDAYAIAAMRRMASASFGSMSPNRN